MGARKVLALTGNEAAAYAMRQLRPDVVAAYPITPQTDVVQAFATFVHEGVVPTEFVPVESEHSAMSVCVGAAAAGGRVMTASSSQGIALMAEMLLVASGNRLPIVMAVAARSLSAPINIMCDHSDVMLVRDAGWLQLFCTDAQQVYDTTIQAIRIAEHLEVRLPVMVCYDGFITSHALTPVEVLGDEEVQGFVGPYRPIAPLLDVEHPVTYGAMDLRDYFFEHKRQQAEAFMRAADVVTEVGAAYGALTGRAYGLLQAHRLEDAELAVVALGSTASTALGVVDDLRGEGERVGLLHLRTFRPFPVGPVRECLRPLKAVAVLDRVPLLGAAAGPLALEVQAAVGAGEGTPSAEGAAPAIVSRVYGLGGRDIGPEELRAVYAELRRVASGAISPGEAHRVPSGPADGAPAPFAYLGLRERRSANG